MSTFNKTLSLTFIWQYPLNIFRSILISVYVFIYFSRPLVSEDGKYFFFIFFLKYINIYKINEFKIKNNLNYNKGN